MQAPLVAQPGAPRPPPQPPARQLTQLVAGYTAAVMAGKFVGRQQRRIARRRHLQQTVELLTSSAVLGAIADDSRRSKLQVCSAVVQSSARLQVSACMGNNK